MRRVSTQSQSRGSQSRGSQSRGKPPGGRPSDGRSSGGRPSDGRPSDGKDGRKPWGQGPPRRTFCYFCANKIGKQIDYKDIPTLRRFTSDRGKILPRRVTKICDKHQRLVTRAISRARNIALFPFTVE